MGWRVCHVLLRLAGALPNVASDRPALGLYCLIAAQPRNNRPICSCKVLKVQHFDPAPEKSEGVQLYPNAAWSPCLRSRSHQQLASPRQLRGRGLEAGGEALHLILAIAQNAGDAVPVAFGLVEPATPAPEAKPLAAA